MSSLRKFDDPKLAEKFQKLFGLESQYCMRTILRALHRMNAFHLNTRRKQTMTKSDKQLRLKSFKQCIKFADFELWVDIVSFYFDGVTFYHKYNPFNEAVQPKVKIWQKCSESLSITCKEKKNENNGCQVKLFVTVAYGRGVAVYEDWNSEEKFICQNYRNFVISQ